MAVTFVVSDSRGAKLAPLYNESYNEDVRIFFYPGASLTKLVFHAVSLIQHVKPRLMIIMGGINDLTILNRDTRHVSLKFVNPTAYADHIIEIINAARVLVGNEFPNTLLSFAGIIGMDLKKYNRMPGAADCQTSINAAMLDVNKRIADNNHSAGVPHMYFTTKVHKWVEGTCQHRYSLLYDGLHPSETVLKHWIKTIHQMHLTIGGATNSSRLPPVS